MKRTISLILVLVMLALTVISCGNAGENTTSGETTVADTTTASGAETSDTTTATEATTEAAGPTNMQDTLPEADFGGKTFTALVRESTKSELFSADIAGDLVGDAVYNRNAKIEDRFGVDIEILTEAGDWNQRDAFINRVSNSILGGDHEFDMVMTHNGYLVSITQRGLCLDMNELEAVDFSKRWWAQKYMENIAMNGKVYAAMGDIGYSLYQYMETVFFNKNLAEENSIPDLYALVESGDWTFDKMMEYVKTVGADLNGDGKYTELDRFGLAIDHHNSRYAATVWQTEITKIGADGRRDINLPNERYVNCYETLRNAIYDNQQVFYVGQDKYDEVKMFANDQLLFMTERIGEASKLREMQSDYGIIPFPKYDAEQKEYVSATRDSHSGIMVANNIEDPAMVGTVVEALCMYGMSDITPAYYETTLKLKYLSDETAMGMLDLIRDSVDFDFAILYTMPLNYIYSFYGTNMDSGTASISAAAKAQAGVWQKMLDKMYDEFDRLAQ